MSDAGSINMSTESRSSSPAPIPVPAPVSPRTVDSILHNGQDIDTATLRGIAGGLVNTIKERELGYQGHQLQYQNHIDELEEKIKHYQDTFKTPPEGYVENNDKIPNFLIPYDEGLFLPAKWVKQLNDGHIAGYPQQDGPTDTPFVIEPYAAPSFDYEELATPLALWYTYLLTGTSAKFMALHNTTTDLDDWGLLGEVLHFCELDNHIQLRQAHIRVLEQEVEAICEAHEMCKFRLEAARADKRVSNLQRLSDCEGPERSGWKRANRFRRGCPF